MKLTKELINQAYQKALNQDIREQDSKTITSFAEALFEEFNKLITPIEGDKCDNCESINTKVSFVGECHTCNWDSLNPIASKEVLLSLGILNDIKAGECTHACIGRGDCEYTVGLPGISIPGQHDGPDDTVDIYNKPNGWCWSCWKSKQIRDLEKRISDMALVKEDREVTPADLQNCELYRMQMAAISTASLGYWKTGDTIHPDYLTSTLTDVATLYSRYNSLYKQEKANLELPVAITRDYVDKLCGDPEKAHYTLFPNTFHTVCCITLPNGATVIGESVCAASKVFNEKLGREYAFIAAKEKVWEFEGYALCEKRYQAGLEK